MEIPLTDTEKAIGGAGKGVGGAQGFGFGYSKLLMPMRHLSGKVD